MDISRRRKYIEKENIKTNYSTIFIIPMLEYPSDYFPSEFISAYILDEKEPKIVCTFDNSDSEYLKGTIWEIQNHDDFLSLDYDDNNREIVVKFRVPKEFVIDYNLFKIGRYTKFSKKYKEILLDIHGRKTGNGECIKMVDALFPDMLSKQFRADQMGISVSELVDNEVMSIIDMKNEEYKTVDKFITERVQDKYDRSKNTLG